MGPTGLGRVLGPSRLRRRASSLLQRPVSLMDKVAAWKEGTKIVDTINRLKVLSVMVPWLEVAC